jgi:hypothetical protein
MCALPLRQVIQQGGWTCGRSPTLLAFVLLLVGWVAYAAINSPNIARIHELDRRMS